MTVRILLGKNLIRFGGFMQTLAVALMKPDDLIEFGRRNYSQNHAIENWDHADVVDSGLSVVEKNLLENMPLKSGTLLDLGMGCGREAIALARLGYKVTGVDFIPEMLKRAKENASKKGVTVSCLSPQEISKLDIPEGYYDVVWFSEAMYSSVPTRNRRVEMLKRIQMALKPGGYCACQFFLTDGDRASAKSHFLRKAFAFITLGNFEYEAGDMLWGNEDFIHAFASEDELLSEFRDAGFEAHYFYHGLDNGSRKGAVLKKL